MKITRRSLAKTMAVNAAASAAIPASILAQSRPAASLDTVAVATRAEYARVARDLASVKLARTVEPVCRFEA